MAVYKVPQDVEADDKLIGPFSFRQFIYLIVVAVSIALAWFLSQLFIGLVILPLPFIIFFGALALPLRKDQPMETYLLAMVRFYFKPKSRLWAPEGNLSHISITAAKADDVRLTKDFDSEEADRRLAYLSQVIDTGGWASRGVINQPTSLSDTYYNEAMQTEDIMDTNTTVAQSFNALIDREDEQHKRMVAAQFQQAMAQPPSSASAQNFTNSITDDAALQVLQDANQTHLEANPYPTSINQTVIQPLDPRHQVPTHQPQPLQSPAEQITQAAPTYQAQPMPPTEVSYQPPTSSYAPAPAPTPINQPQQNPVTNPVAPAVSSDIMRLASNSSHLTVSALAHEAHRLENRDEEVVIDFHHDR